MNPFTEIMSSNNVTEMMSWCTKNHAMQLKWYYHLAEMAYHNENDVKM